MDKGDFNGKAASEEGFSFEKEMRRKFDADTARQIVETLGQLQIPAPQSKEEYLDAHAGALIFSNRHGVMFRIESPTTIIPDDEGFAVGTASRANDSAWMLQPIGTVKAGKAVIEIVPGVHYENRDAESRKLYWKMWSDGYEYWDDRVDNIGRLPKLPGLPGEGVPVIIDRLAVAHLSGSNGPFRRALEVLKGERNLYKYRSPVRVPPSPNSDLRQEWDQMVQEVTAHKIDPEAVENKYDRASYEAFISNPGQQWPKGDKSPSEAVGDDYHTLVRGINVLTQERIKDTLRSRDKLGDSDPQEILYGGLRRAFGEAWKNDGAPNPKGIEAFWRQVLSAKEEGRLVAGWNELDEKADERKTVKAVQVAAAYDAQASKIGVTPAPAAKVKLAAPEVK